MVGHTDGVDVPSGVVSAFDCNDGDLNDPIGFLASAAAMADFGCAWRFLVMGGLKFGSFVEALTLLFGGSGSDEERGKRRGSSRDLVDSRFAAMGDCEGAHCVVPNRLVGLDAPLGLGLFGVDGGVDALVACLLEPSFEDGIELDGDAITLGVRKNGVRG
jgi:hypothetical protein